MFMIVNESFNVIWLKKKKNKSESVLYMYKKLSHDEQKSLLIFLYRSIVIHDKFTFLLIMFFLLSHSTFKNIIEKNYRLTELKIFKIFKII